MSHISIMLVKDKIKAYKNQKCMECGKLTEYIYIYTPNCVSNTKSWKLCLDCAYNILK